MQCFKKEKKSFKVCSQKNNNNNNASGYELLGIFNITLEKIAKVNEFSRKTAWESRKFKQLDLTLL